MSTLRCVLNFSTLDRSGLLSTAALNDSQNPVHWVKSPLKCLGSVCRAQLHIRLYSCIASWLWSGLSTECTPTTLGPNFAQSFQLYRMVFLAGVNTVGSGSSRFFLY